MKGKEIVACHSTQWKQLFRRFLSLVFNYARENNMHELIPQPVTSKTAIKVEHQYKENFTATEMEALFRVARNMNERVILALGFWGVRPAEICAVRWSKLSQDGTVLHLDKQIKFARLGRKQGIYIESKQKTTGSNRRILLKPGHFVYEILQAAKAVRNPDDDFILSRVPGARVQARITAPYISKLIPELCRLADIPVRNAYVMKSSAISLLAISGVDVNTTSAITGVSVQTILKHYDRANKLSRQDYALPKFNLQI
jgi:integrase